MEQVLDKPFEMGKEKPEKVELTFIQKVKSAFMKFTMVTCLLTILTLGVLYSIGNVQYIETPVQNIIVERMTVDVGHAYWMPWGNQIIRFSGSKFRGTIEPATGKFDYYTYNDGFKLMQSGVTKIDLSTRDKDGKVYFKGAGISGWVQLPVDSTLGLLEMRVDLNFKISG